jgi:hypothetical protein
VGKHTTLPMDLLTKVELELWSEAEGKVPHGAWQELQIELLTEWLARRQHARQTLKEIDKQRALG